MIQDGSQSGGCSSWIDFGLILHGDVALSVDGGRSEALQVQAQWFQVEGLKVIHMSG